MSHTHNIPLLKDHHNHLTFYALLHSCLNLQEVATKKDALAMIQAMENSKHGQKVSVVLGWNSGYYNFEEEELDILPPVIIVNVSLHQFLVTPKAESLLRKRYPDIIANYKDAQWFEDNMPRMLLFLAQQVEATAEKFKHFFDDLLKKGVYYIEEMHLPSDQAYQLLQSSPFALRTSFWTTPETYKQLNSDTQAAVKGLKFFTDGAVGAKTAALSAPYLDGAEGYLLYRDETLYRQLRDVSRSGKAAAIHAIGDLATEQTVRILGQLKKDGYQFPMVRMEHCQFISNEIAKEAKKLGIILSMQPNFSADSIVYKDRLSPFYLENNNPFRMLIDDVGFVPGEDLLLGSDGMPQGAEAAIKESLFPPCDQQKLTLDELTAAYCMKDKQQGAIQIELKNNTLASISVLV
jgi:predicted amidohydrolase YtcJ